MPLVTNPGTRRAEKQPRRPYSGAGVARSIDLATYTREVYTAQDTGRFILGFTICGSFLRIWEFDRLCVSVSERFNINEDGWRFVFTVLRFL